MGWHKSLILAIAAVILIFGPAAAFAQSDAAEKLPMFGQPKSVRPESLKKNDEIFIRDAVLRYGNRVAASNALATQGWDAIRAKQPDLAMLRFNQAWLLNPKNYRAHWGFGALIS